MTANHNKKIFYFFFYNFCSRRGCETLLEMKTTVNEGLRSCAIYLISMYGFTLLKHTNMRTLQEKILIVNYNLTDLHLCINCFIFSLFPM